LLVSLVAIVAEEIFETQSEGCLRGGGTEVENDGDGEGFIFAGRKGKLWMCLGEGGEHEFGPKIRVRGERMKIKRRGVPEHAFGVVAMEATFLKTTLCSYKGLQTAHMHVGSVFIAIGNLSDFVSI
jgi:hypothetical protein